MTRRQEVAGLVVVLLVAAVLRLAACGADVPVELGMDYSPVQDAFWYLEAAASRAEGLELDPEPEYDPPIWTAVARVWLEVAGSGHRSACALAGVLGVALVLATWKVARAGLGPGAGLASAAVLATLWPQVTLSRVPLVYVPVAVWLLAAAALWLHGRTREGAARLACELGAWAMVLGATIVIRPPAAGLVGGLLAGQLVRSPQARPTLLVAIGGLVALAVLVGTSGRLALEPPLQLAAWISPERADVLRYRLGLRLHPDASPGLFLRGALRFFALPDRAGTGSGYFALAPGACALAALGAALVAVRWRSLRPAARETLAVLLGWAAAFVLGGLIMRDRPLRYFLLIGPALATLAGCAVVWTWAHLPLLRPPARRFAALILLGVACVDGALRFPSPTWTTLAANRALPAIVGSRAVLVGPYASSLAIGSGLRRLRGTWVRTEEETDATIARLGSAGATHILVDPGQAGGARLEASFRERGVPLELVAEVVTAAPLHARPRGGVTVRVYRLPPRKGP